MTATAERIERSTRPLQMSAVVPVVSAGIVVTALLLLLAGVYGLVAGILLTAVAAVLRVRGLSAGIEDEVLARIGAEPVSGPLEARLINLAEGLAAQRGVPLPVLRVVDDPGANMLVVGMTPERSALVVTSGLLSALDRFSSKRLSVAASPRFVREISPPAPWRFVRSAGPPPRSKPVGCGRSWSDRSPGWSPPGRHSWLMRIVTSCSIRRVWH